MITQRYRTRVAAAVAACCLGLAFANTSGAVDLRDWGRKLPASERFVILSQFNDQAVLDKETQLVWQRSPSIQSNTWEHGREQCSHKHFAGRWGWRLPFLHELSSLLQPGPLRGPLALPAGHPFTNVQIAGYWTATRPATTSGSAYVVALNGNVGLAFIGENSKALVWCVRGGGPLGEY